MNPTELLVYDPSIPQGLRWKVKPSNRVHKGAPAGGLTSKRYYSTMINKKHYSNHRRIWEVVHGPIPDGMCIDHIDRNTKNNTVSNLRLANCSNNNWNRSRSVVNTTGYKGVSKSKNGKYQAAITKNYIKYYIGVYTTPEEASAAYAAYATTLYGEFAHHG